MMTKTYLSTVLGRKNETIVIGDEARRHVPSLECLALDLVEMDLHGTSRLSIRTFPKTPIPEFLH